MPCRSTLPSSRSHRYQVGASARRIARRLGRGTSTPPRFVALTPIGLGSSPHCLLWMMSTVKYIHACGASSVTHQCLKSIGCLQELQHAMDELHAFGVAFASCYGEGSAASTSYSDNSYPTPALISMAEYVGHETYHPIWDELNKRKTIVFLHGAQVPSSTPYPHDFLGVPITEVSPTHNRTICDLITTKSDRHQTRHSKQPHTSS